MSRARTQQVEKEHIGGTATPGRAAGKEGLGRQAVFGGGPYTVAEREGRPAPLTQHHQLRHRTRIRPAEITSRHGQFRDKNVDVSVIVRYLAAPQPPARASDRPGHAPPFPT